MENFFSHFFTPQPSNNHKPRLLHHTFLVFYMTVFIVLQMVLGFLVSADPRILGLATDIKTADLLSGINQKRMENALPALILDNALSQAAYAKAQDMFNKGYWSHFSPDGVTPWFFIEQAGYQYKYAGENLARDFAVSDQVVSAWMDSDTHRKNILDAKFADVGFAVVNGTLNGEETTLVVQLFGAKTQKIPAVSAVNTVSEKVMGLAQTETSPTPKPDSVILSNPTVVSDTKITAAKAANQPVFNIFGLTKKLAIVLSVFLILFLYVDLMMISKKKIYRISGNNIAHILFLIFVLVALYWSKHGVIV